MTDDACTLKCDCEPVIDAEFENFADHSPSEVIVQMVAAAAGVDPLDLPPLYEHVDPDAVDALLGGHDGTANPALCFEIDTWVVFIAADGKICVCDSTRPIEPQPVFESNTAEP